MILGNINIVSDGQKTDDLVSLCSLLDLYFCNKGYCFLLLSLSNDSRL